MSKEAASLGQLHRRHQHLARQLSQLGLISQGSVQDRTARQRGGAGYQWTRKVAQKTITVSLTAEQFTKMKEAVANYRTCANNSGRSKAYLGASSFSPHRTTAVASVCPRSF